MNTENRVATITLNETFSFTKSAPEITTETEAYPCGPYTVHTQCMYGGDGLCGFRLEVHSLGPVVSWSTTITGCARAWHLYMESNFISAQAILQCNKDEALAALYTQRNLKSMMEVIDADVQRAWANLTLPAIWYVEYARVLRELGDRPAPKKLLELSASEETLSHRTVLARFLKRNPAGAV
jgi:hypothetical protein